VCSSQRQLPFHQTSTASRHYALVVGHGVCGCAMGGERRWRDWLNMPFQQLPFLHSPANGCELWMLEKHSRNLRRCHTRESCSSSGGMTLWCRSTSCTTLGFVVRRNQHRIRVLEGNYQVYANHNMLFPARQSVESVNAVFENS